MEPAVFTVAVSTFWPEVLERVPNDIHLFPHQVDCVKWLADREKNNCNSNLLGDVMGLGKTMSTIALITINLVNKTLIVCPKSLVCQWARELIIMRRRVYFIQPDCAHRVILMNNKIVIQKNTLRHTQLREPYVCISTFGRVKAFPEPKHSVEMEMSVFDCATKISPRELIPFSKITWDRIVVDEVHSLRNGISLRGDKTAKLRKSSLKYHRMLRLLKTQNTKMLGLTGSPLQNRYGDLASIFMFIGCKGIDSSVNEILLKKLMLECVFRRNASNLTPLTKSLISFPTEPYTEAKVLVQYETVEEKNFYIAAAGQLAEKLKTLLDGYEALVVEDNILLLFTLLRLLSSHPAAFVNCYNKKYSTPIPEWSGSVSKLNMIEAHLNQLSSSGQSCIVFCHFNEEATQICNTNHGYTNVEFINGNISMEDRDYVISDSRAVVAEGGTYLILANIASCGEGFNVQHIQNVILPSIDWNPKAEEQAIARTHRIGQKGKVVVTRYYHEAIENLKDTLNIDKYMKIKQEYKKELAQDLIDNTPNAAWQYPITLIPGHDVPSTIFPPITHKPVRIPITAPPRRKKILVKERMQPQITATKQLAANTALQTRKEKTDMIATITQTRLDNL